MAKLFPPHIEGKLPAFVKGEYIKIPITMNRAVSLDQVGNMYAIIKTVQTNSIIANGLKGDALTFDDTTNTYYAIFDSSIIKNLNVGQFYKIQIAYGDRNANDEIGYYSTVGVLKCTTKPSVSIPGLVSNYYNSNDFVGVCDWGESGDITEKVYSYCFTIKDNNNNVVATSGEQLHNNYKDTLQSSTDSWTINLSLEEGKLYFITYQIKTINDLTVVSQTYIIIQQDTVDPDLPCNLVCKLNYDEGLVSLYLRPTEARGLSGSFILSRASDKDGYKTWDEIYRFAYKGYLMTPRDNTTGPSNWGINDILVWEDHTIEQGVNYIYSLQAYNARGLYSNRVFNKKEKFVSQNALGVYITEFEDEIIKADFEDAFLSDKDRQLKIKFNPKVSSFKNTILETKIDTIGSQYPFIFRNGNVGYKEFPISGLISLIMDEEERFVKGIQNNLITISRSNSTSAPEIYDSDIQLSSNNFKRERNFKMEVLEWLNNGQPKLFRSPGEGNFIVRLMNTSLTPNDTLGRMLHTFQTTAYEIADCDFVNMTKLGLISTPFGENKYLKIGQIKLASPPLDFSTASSGRVIYLKSFYHTSITDASPGTIIKLEFSNGISSSIEIGGTGSYIVPLKDVSLTRISVVSGMWDNAVLNFCYYDDKPTDNFNTITDIKVKDEVRQIVGTGFIKNKEDTYNVVGENYGGSDYPSLKRLADIRRQAGRFHIIKIRQRPTIVCYEAPGNEYSFNTSGNNILKDNDWFDNAIYEVHNTTQPDDILYYMYGKNRVKSYADPDYRFQINEGAEIDIGGNPNSTPKTFGRIESLIGIEDVESMYLGTGVLVDACYRLKEIQYIFEDEDDVVKKCKEYYEIACDNYQKALENGEDLTNYLNEIEATYQDYVDRLEDDIEEWRKGNYGV